MNTIEPATIVTIEDWSNAYLKYANVTLTDGIPTVLSRTDTSIVKRIPLGRGRELYTVLQEGGSAAEAMLEKKEELDAAIVEGMTEASNECTEAEQRLLLATDAWRMAATPADKAAAAISVAMRSFGIDVKGRALRNAEFPDRHSALIIDVKHRDFDYRTGDDRVKTHLLQLRSCKYSIKTRAITEEDTA